MTRAELIEAICEDDIYDVPMATQVLDGEEQALQNDRELYLECLSGTPIKDRAVSQLRNGLILYWHVYQSIKQRQEKDKCPSSPSK